MIKNFKLKITIRYGESIGEEIDNENIIKAKKLSYIPTNYNKIFQLSKYVCKCCYKYLTINMILNHNN